MEESAANATSQRRKLKYTNKNSDSSEEKEKLRGTQSKDNEAMTNQMIDATVAMHVIPEPDQISSVSIEAAENLK